MFRNPCDCATDDQDDAAILAVIGSGVQARSRLRVIEQAWELSEGRVWSPTPEHQDAFIEEMRSSTTARLTGADSSEDAVRGADLVVLAGARALTGSTMASRPVTAVA